MPSLVDNTKHLPLCGMIRANTAPKKTQVPRYSSLYMWVWHKYMATPCHYNLNELSCNGFMTTLKVDEYL